MNKRLFSRSVGYLGVCLLSLLFSFGARAQSGDLSISGPSTVCVLSPTAFTPSATGGSWSSSDNSVATVDASGNVTGLVSGTAIISYVVAGSPAAVQTITVVGFPYPTYISGPSTLFVGEWNGIYGLNPGGTYSSSNDAIATIDVYGNIHGVSHGTVTFTYALSNSCGGVSYAYKTVAVTGLEGTVGCTPLFIHGDDACLAEIAILHFGVPGVGGASIDDNSGCSRAGYEDHTSLSATLAAGTTVVSNITVGTGFQTSTQVWIDFNDNGLFEGSETVGGLNDQLGNFNISLSIPSGATPGTHKMRVLTGFDIGYYPDLSPCGTYQYGNAKDYMVNIVPATVDVTISGATSVCLSATTSFTASVPGGTWSSSDNSIATVDASGTVTSVASGGVTISYSVSGAASVATQSITVNPAPDAGTISGPTTVCTGSSITLSSTVTGGTWTASNGLVTTDASGLIAGNIGSSGASTITYTVSNDCGTASATTNIDVVIPANAGTLTGSDNVCVGSSIYLTPEGSTGEGPLWYFSGSAISTDYSGTIYGVEVGTTTVTYTVNNICGISSATKFITVNPLPDAASISGTNTAVAGTSVSLIDYAIDGTWSSSDPSIATVDASGVVAAVAAGSTTISYSVTNGCGTAVATMAFTVTGGDTIVASVPCYMPASGLVAWYPFSGNANDYSGNGNHGVNYGATDATDRFGNANSAYDFDGTWHFVDVSIATPVDLNAVAGLTLSTWCKMTDLSGLYGLSLLYNSGTGEGTGMYSDYYGRFLADAGIYDGATAGTWYNIVTTLDTATNSKKLYINGVLQATDLTGFSRVVLDHIHIGKWSDYNGWFANGQIDDISIYNRALNADEIAQMFASNTPLAISGSSSVNIGDSAILSTNVNGGTWNSDNVAVANVNASGVVTTVVPGHATISYTVTTGCGTSTDTMALTVAVPASVPCYMPASGLVAWYPFAGNAYDYSGNGNSGVNYGATDATDRFGNTNSAYDFDGTWHFVDAAIATPIDLNTVAGLTMSTWCKMTDLSGLYGLSLLYNSGTGEGSGMYSDYYSQFLADAGIYDGAIAGAWYNIVTTLDTATNTKKLYINGVLQSTDLTGFSRVVLDHLHIGKWSDYNGWYANGQIDDISIYNRPLTADEIAQMYSAGTLVVTGSSDACVGNTISLTASAVGGTWSSDNTSVALVDDAGVVTPVSSGSATISYAVTTGCGAATATHSVTINPAANAGTIAPVFGGNELCEGTTTNFASTGDMMGMWVSSNTSVATVDVNTGLVGGHAEGPATISYTVTNACGTSSTATYDLTILSLPHVTVGGMLDLCPGSSEYASVSLYAPGTGSWSSTNSSIAAVDAYGNVLGVSAGTVTISYNTTNACGSAGDGRDVTVNPSPNAGTISGPDSICASALYTYYSSDGDNSGFTWSTNNGFIDFGYLEAVTAGTATITYSVSNSCGNTYATKTVTVTGLPDAGSISGSTSAVTGASVTLTASVAGGTWSSDNTAVADVDASGVVTAIAPGSATIAYYVSNYCAVSNTTLSFTVNAPAGVPCYMPASGLVAWYPFENSGQDISGNGNDLTNVGGVTFSTDRFGMSNGAASFNGSGQTMRKDYPSFPAGNSDRTYSVWYNNASSASNSVLFSTDNSYSSTCNQNFSLFTDPTGYYLWAKCYDKGSANSNALSTWTNVVVVNKGNKLFIYKNGNLANDTLNPYYNLPGLNTVPTQFTVGAVFASDVAFSHSFNGLIDDIAVYNRALTSGEISQIYNGGVGIEGPLATCVGGSVNLSATFAGGTWSSSNEAVATVDASGIVYGVTGGSATISYSLTGGCGVGNAVHDITVNTALDTTVITGASSICGSPVSLSVAAGGGVWATSNDAVAIVTAGTVTGLSDGSAVISYTLTNGCGSFTATKNMSVNTIPSAISGPTTLCVGAAIALSNTATSGVWSASNTKVSVNASNGVVTGVTAGTVTITFTNCSGTRTYPLTVLSSPAAITGINTICQGAITTLADATTGGTWSDNGSGFATINPATRVVTGIAAGTATVTYTIANGCFVTRPVVVNAAPAAMSTPAPVCVGTIITLTNTVDGGVWSSSAPTKATVSTNGSVRALSAGVATISYSIGSCRSTVLFTVSPTPVAITGTSAAICAGSATTFADATAGGTWSTADATIASVTSTAPIMVSGISAGTTTVTYAIGSCAVTKPVTVNTAPGPLASIPNMCVGTTVSLSNAVAGGVWSTSQPTRATITSAGVLTSLSPYGGVTISYTLGSCASSATFNVNTTPGAINGSGSICIGAAVTIYNGTTGGVWTSSNPGVATLAGTGISTVLQGASAGTANITYAIGSCYSIKSVTVSVAPDPLPVLPPVCAGTVVSLSNTVAGGTWSSSTYTSSTISSSGVITALAAGSSIIRYGIGSCIASTMFTVLPTPGPITGNGVLCQGSSVTLSNSQGGGTWTISDGVVASVSGSVYSGVVTGTGAGSAVITYALGSCYSTKAITVNVNPAPLAAIGPVCAGTVLTLSNAVPGGVWSSTVYTSSTISPSGVLTGMGAGTTTIKYSIGSCIVSVPFTVSPTPTAVSGAGSVCTGATIVVADGYSGGTWTVSNPIRATISGSGTAATVTGLSAGTVNVTYSIGSCSATKAITVNNCGAKEDPTGNGVELGADNSNVTVFPNPATNRISIKALVPVNVKLFTPDGKLVMTQSDAHELSVDNLSSGVYIIMIYDLNDTLLKTERLVKMD
ncbi:hypothetical protein CJD36_018795 [Flavipsychrobacter stenotrophus]|uniref:BIG2 domain-containing protein n=1 Tax=Flavipsychrobacter stenotrophus TaxID=2077091 RepID=A0A2S7SRF3_9BACT|nr:Ig-like domain-containing protein [Flavipsychrobacter stenotrophus]PQJ09298.1 hypothetical protein CJD36_018795 [Flavipsychrobacter stenotrophus]